MELETSYLLLKVESALSKISKKNAMRGDVGQGHGGECVAAPPDFLLRHTVCTRTRFPGLSGVCVGGGSSFGLHRCCGVNRSHV